MNNNINSTPEIRDLEDLLKTHKAEINAAFETKGVCRRMKDMFVGLTKPKKSAEYKLARLEVQRLTAPALAVLVPTLTFVALMVVTSIKPPEKVEYSVPILPVDPPPIDDLFPDPDPKPRPIDDDVDIDVTPDSLPTPDPTPVPAPAPEPIGQNAIHRLDEVKPTPSIVVERQADPYRERRRKLKELGSDLGGHPPKATQLAAPSSVTEGAVLAALRWLKSCQQPNGTINDGNASTTLANTSLSILAFLAHGETPGRKEFGATVEKALNFVIGNHYVDKDGVSRFKTADGNEYAYLIATYALCEAYGMTQNPNVKGVARTALQRIVDNQSPTGGWDYRINGKSTRDDMSFAGWALQALKAGKMAGLHPEGLDACIKKAVRCLKARNFRNGGFNYTAGGIPTGLTATGCLAMQLLGHMNEKEVKESLETMRTWLPGFDQPPKGKRLNETLPGPNPQYYSYYVAQCKYQAGMCAGATKANVKAWQDWDQAMKTLYPKSMVILPKTIPGPDGKPRMMGYWSFNDLTCKPGGKTMATCLCALQLMVYYRNLPTMQTTAASAETRKTDRKALRRTDEFVAVDI